MKTSKEKMTALRKRRREEGFKQIQLWIRPDHEEFVRRFVAFLEGKFKKQKDVENQKPKTEENENEKENGQLS